MKLRTLRKVIFWLFVILYFITAPIITLHALGFVFDPVSKSLVKTGIISIATEPRQADIFLNEHFHDKTPAAISGLKPGFYRVKISRKGYQDWARELEVRQEEVSRIEHILLVSKELQLSKPFAYPLEAFLASDDDKYLFLIYSARNKITVLAYDVKKKKSFPVIELDTKEFQANSIEISSSIDEKRVLAGFQNGSQTNYAVSLISEDALPVFLSKLISEPISNVRFHPHDSEKLFYLSGNQIGLLDLKDRSNKINIVNSVISFEVIGDKIYCFDLNQNLFTVDLEGKRMVDLLPNPGLKKFLFGGDDFKPYLTFMTEKGTTFWLSEKGKLLMNRLPYFIDEDVKSIKLAPDAEQLVYWKGKELWLLDLQTAGKRDSFFEEGPQKKLIWRSDKRILFAQIIRQGSYVVAATNRTIELIEIKSLNEGFAPSWTIAEHWADDGLSIHLDEASGKMYWTGCYREERREACETDLFDPSLFSFSIKLKKPYRSPAQVSFS